MQCDTSRHCGELDFKCRNYGKSGLISSPDRDAETIAVKKRIMFVNDEQRVLDSLRRLLRTRCNDWEMTFVDRPEVVCDRLKSAPCDVVVSDMKMPGLDGLGLLANMRQNGQLHDIPVVLLTGMADRTLKRHALDLGAADLLNKPVDPADLIARIESVLRNRSWRSSSVPMRRRWSGWSRSGRPNCSTLNWR